MNLIKSTGTFGFFTLLSRILGYLRDLLIAIYLGSGPLADAFFVAFRIPNTFRRLFSEGTFNAAFVPSYSAEITKGKNQSKKFANEVFNLLIIGLFFLIIIIEIFMPWFILLIAPGFKENSDKLELTIYLTRITFPFLFFISLASFFAAVLNSHNKFALAAAAPIVLNIVLILTLLLTKYLGDNLVEYLAYAVTISGFIQFAILMKFVKNFIPISFAFKLKVEKKVKFFFSKLLPSIFSSGVTQINILVGTIIASFQASAVSYLYYADRIYQINLAIAGIAIGTVLLPNLSKYVKENKKKKIDLIQNKSLELSLFLSLPATFALLIASEEITSSLFGYGSFDIQSVKNSANALFYFALGLPAFAFIKVFSSFIFARQNTKVPFYFSVISVIINIIISLYFFNQIGFIIIPIATSVSSWINSILLLIYLTNKNFFTFRIEIIFSFLKIIFTSIIASLFFYYLLNLSRKYLMYDSSFKLITIVSLIILTLIVYFLLSIITKAFKMSDIKLKY